MQPRVRCLHAPLAFLLAGGHALGMPPDVGPAPVDNGRALAPVLSPEILKTGNGLLEMCRERPEADKDPLAMAYQWGCQQYISGFVDATRAHEMVQTMVAQAAVRMVQAVPGEDLQTTLGKVAKDLPPSVRTAVGVCFGSLVAVGICTPDGATYGQYVRVVRRFLEEHPERLHEPRSTLVYEALSTAFPCGKKPD